LEYVNTSYNDIFAFLVEGPGLSQNDSIWVAGDTAITQNWDSCYFCIDTVLVINETFCYFDSLTMIDTCLLYSDTLYQYCYYDQNCAIDTVIYPGYWYLSPGGVNIAQIPNTNLPVAINTLNQFANTQYFVDNANDGTVQYDAFTTPLWAELAVQAGQTYHIRIAIADAGDGIYDSGVFMSIESLGGDSLLPVIPEFSFVAPTQGQNEVVFENNSFWGTEYLWDFGDGTTSTEKNPTHYYAADGSYTAKLTVKNWCSSKTYEQAVVIGVSSTTVLAADVFRVLPNPTSGSFILDLKNDGEATMRLTRLDGKLVFEGNAQDGAKFDLNKYGKGTYVLQVVAEGKVFMDKVINQ
jgi:PKD repeat protein